jgi:hypothetical protein
MSYKPTRKKFKLVFDESFDDLKGLEITYEALQLGEVRTILDKTDDLDTLWETQDYQHAEMVKRVIEWNIEGEDGEIAPISVDSLRLLDPVDVGTVVSTWFKRCLGVTISAPLEQPSNDGGSTEPTDSLPMATR